MKNLPKNNANEDKYMYSIFNDRESMITWKSPDSKVYEKLSKVGQGTYGKVYKARIKHKSNSKDEKIENVALKKIILEKEKDGFPLTAIREIMILRRLKHKNISNLLEVAVSSKSEKNNKRGNVYLVFEYMELDLYKLLNSNNVHLSVPQIKLILFQVLSGLQYLKKNNIIHRDLKTSNILINNKGVVKIADFGLARNHNPRTKHPYTNLVVTLWYRAPEILLGGRYDMTSDVWSAGIVFAELLTKNCPFRGNIEVDQLHRIYDLCGVPNEENWPGVTSLKNYKIFLPDKMTENKLKSELAKINKIDELGIDLLVKMLELDPNKRISIDDAINHQYFYNAPNMCAEDDLPKYEGGTNEVENRSDIVFKKSPKEMSVGINYNQNIKP